MKCAVTANVPARSARPKVRVLRRQAMVAVAWSDSRSAGDIAPSLLARAFVKPASCAISRGGLAARHRSKTSAVAELVIMARGVVDDLQHLPAKLALVFVESALVLGTYSPPSSAKGCAAARPGSSAELMHLTTADRH